MTPDCYEFYLWSIGELALDPFEAIDLIDTVNERNLEL